MEARTHPLKWILAVLIVALPTSARAQQPLTGVDGCAILASVVYTEVTEARLGYYSGPSGDPFFSGQYETTLCDETAHSVTRAFTAALRQANIDVTWGFHVGYSGDYCPGHVLSQCFPTGDPAMPPLSERDRSFVMRSWEAVYDSVSGQMSLYPGSNVSRFQGSELGRSIRRLITASNAISVASDGRHLPGEEQ